MRTHGKGPKNGWVRAYDQVRGRKKVQMRTHPRHTPLRLRCRACEAQMDFGF